MFVISWCHTYKFASITIGGNSIIALLCFTSLSTICQKYRGAISFIGGGRGVLGEKPPTCRKSLTKFITLCRSPLNSFQHNRYFHNIEYFNILNVKYLSKPLKENLTRLIQETGSTTVCYNLIHEV
jgi:hypothetical protein